jgi:hypothetical protein
MEMQPQQQLQPQHQQLQQHHQQQAGALRGVPYQAQHPSFALNPFRSLSVQQSLGSQQYRQGCVYVVLCVCALCVYVCVCVCVACVCACVLAYVHVCIFMRECVCMCMWVCVFVCLRMCMCVWSDTSYA